MPESRLPIPEGDRGSGVILVCLALIKVPFSLNSCFLQNIDIPTCQKVILALKVGRGELPYRMIWKKFGQNLVLFLFFDLSCAKTCLNGRHYWVLMKLGDFIENNAKISRIMTKSCKFFLYCTKTWFPQNHASTDIIVRTPPSCLKGDQHSWKLA